MTYFRLIAPDWLVQESNQPKVIEGRFSEDYVLDMSNKGYNIYFTPNYSQSYESGTLDGSMIDTFEYVFVDMDMKDGVYKSKEEFVDSIKIQPSAIIDSGNGVHVYWKVSNLDAHSYLKLSRRLMRLYKTDDAVQKIFQLMRFPGSINNKDKQNPKECKIIQQSDIEYTCEELDKVLPPLSVADEAYCEGHYNKTYNVNRDAVKINEVLPSKFGKLLRENDEAKKLWAGNTSDRSGGDYRLGHLMFANGFTKEEAATVLANSAKASERAPIHRQSYAQNIIDKIWTYEIGTTGTLNMSQSIEEILKKTNTNALKGTRYPCHKVIDNTEHGFRLGQVIGLVAGSGVGKTAFALNMFKWWAQYNPDYHAFFVPLEQPANEIADRWQTMCGNDTSLHSKVHVLSNYDDDGNFRHLSLDDIKAHINEFQAKTGHKVGCVMVDHIGALKKKKANGENEALMDICHSMKAFAMETNTLLVMQSQTNREKAGIGDLELNKDAAFGTLFFEAYCDFLITIWQPLKRCHDIPECPTVTAFKFCKIRHKKAKKDIIKEDVPYYLYFDSENESLRDMNQLEEQAFKFFIVQATNKRKQDRKTEIVSYKSVPYKEGAKSEVQSKHH